MLADANASFETVDAPGKLAERVNGIHVRQISDLPHRL
jgi:hypothetical protein